MSEAQIAQTPYWGQLVKLSNEDKRTVISMLEETMVEPKEESFEELWARSVTIEEFRKMCHEEIDSNPYFQ